MMSDLPVFETEEGELAPPNILLRREQLTVLTPPVLYLEDDRVKGRLTFQWRGKKYIYFRVERKLHGVRMTAYKLILEEEQEAQHGSRT